jgi:hypothetical protein
MFINSPFLSNDEINRLTTTTNDYLDIINTEIQRINLNFTTIDEVYQQSLHKQQQPKKQSNDYYGQRSRTSTKLTTGNYIYGLSNPSSMFPGQTHQQVQVQQGIKGFAVLGTIMGALLKG